MARTPILAAGGIVMRRDAPLVAIVRMRKRDHWVLPKGKLDPGETSREGAVREVMEETGHDVTVHEFVGTMTYDVGDRPKVVHFWRMEAEAEQAHELMGDVKAVAWLPLADAVAQLTRGHEQAFLAEVGPQVLEAASRSRAGEAAPRWRHTPSAPWVDVARVPERTSDVDTQLPAGNVAVAPPNEGTRTGQIAAQPPATAQGWFARLWRWLTGVAAN